MARAESVAAVREAGFDFFSDAQLQSLVDKAAAEYQLADLWPWRLTSSQLPAPAIIVDLGPIEAVSYEDGRILKPARLSDLEDDYADLTLAGSPTDYYISDQGERGGTVQVFPRATGQVNVRHYRKRFWTVGGRTAADDSDTLLGPAEGVELVETLAIARAHARNANADGAAAARADYQGLLEAFRERELLALGGIDEPDTIRESEAW